MSVPQTILVGTLVTVISYVGIAYFQKWKSRRIPSNWVQVGTVEKLLIYPLKSAKWMALDKAECTKEGLAQCNASKEKLRLRDRGFMVYDTQTNKSRTARHYPKLVLVGASEHDGNHVAFNAPGMPTLNVKIPNKDMNQGTITTCWLDESINGIDCGDEAASWFSKYCDSDGLRLTYNDGSFKRNISRTHQFLLNYYKNLDSESTGLFSYLTSLLLVNQRSIDDMNSKIHNSNVVVENFRPNIVVDCPDLPPYVEDGWEWIKIGNGIILRNVKECNRCGLTTIDTKTGVRNADGEPLKTLGTYRMSQGPEKSPVMGIHLGVRTTGFLKVGDPVYVSR